MSLRKRITAFLCAAAVVVSGIPAVSPVTSEAKVLNGLKELGRQVAAEGCVLIKNDNNVLPLQKGTTVSIFGRSQCHYDRFKSGLGSGGEVRVDSKNVVSYVDGIRNHSNLNVNEDLVKIYQDWVKQNPYDNGDGNWVNWPWSQKEMPMTQDIANTAKSKSDAAVIIISRTAGENRDSSFQKGGYLLTDEEENMIKIVSQTFDKVVVLLNVTAIIDMNWVDKYDVDSVMYTWNGGQNGGEAVADVLSGDVNPSGRLSDTIATDYTKYPTYKNYGAKEKSYYQEDIFVGYRYFETFAQNDVEYPFGYGLSYTTFDIATNSVEKVGDSLKVTVSVTNTGNVAGKEVVQVYYGAPQAQLGNPAKELAAFAKTRELMPSETQNLALTFKISDMASYDDGGVTGHESAYVLEAGEYKIYVGNNVRNSSLVYTYNQPSLQVTEQLTEAAAPIDTFNRYKAVGQNGQIKLTEEQAPKLKVNVEQKIKKDLPQELQKKDNGKYKLIDVYNGKLSMEQFVAQMTNEEMAAMAMGSKNDAANSVTNGCAGALGGVECKTDGNLTNLGSVYGIPLAAVADGPSGVRISDYATLLPCGNAIGCTWNLDLVEQMFVLEGQELILNNIDSLLGPGINIRRDPRCGRNFEYFSEDPLLSGRYAAVIAQGVQSVGATVTVKHFACNNQECNIELQENRRNIDAVVSERALREIYLKAFEIYVKEGKGRSIMTAYNPINGCWAASNYDLNTQILRKEWGYDGIVMTDWWGHMSKYAWADGSRDRGDGYTATMIKAQNDVFMPVDNIYGNDKNPSGKVTNILNEINNGYLTRAELQRSAVNICTYVMRSQVFATYNKLDFKPYVVSGEEWFKVEQAELGNPKVTGLSVGGRAVATFNPSVLEYKVYLPSNATTIPKVEATAEADTTVTVEQATSSNKIAIIRATEQKATKMYRIVFTDAENVEPVFEDAVLAKLKGIKVNGKAITGFDADTYEYSVAVNSLSALPTIEPEAPEGVTATYAFDAVTNTAVVKAVSKDQARSYKLKFGIAPQSDEFDGTSLNNFWTVTNENKDKLSLNNGRLVIGAEYGSIWQNQAHLKNQVIQSAYGDWEAEVKIDLPKLPSLAYQSLGVIAMQDQDNYIYVKMAYEGNHLEIALCQEKAASISTLEKLSDSDVQKFTNTMYVRLTKLGSTYRAAVSPDGKEYINFATAASADYTDPKFMFVNGNGDKDLPEVLEAQIDYVRFSEAGDKVAIGDETKIKVAEVAPIAISSGLKPAECQDTDKGYHLTGTNEGEYITFNVDVAKTGTYTLTARMASAESDTQQVTFNALVDNEIAAYFFTNGTGGEQAWVDVVGGTTKLTAGTHTLKLAFDTSGINLNWIKLALTESNDDAALKAAIEAAKAKDISGYTEESQNAYKKAIEDAEKALEASESQEAIDAALKALQDAEKALVQPTKPADPAAAKAALEKAVELAKAKYDAGQGDYSDDSWKAFKEAYEKAANPAADATADELNDLKAKLEAAEAGLAVETPPTETENPAAAKAELDKVVNEVKAKYEAGQGDYTDDSWKKFEDAYKAATSPAANATAVELLELRDKLEAAERLLVKKGPDQTETNPGTETQKLAAPTIKSAKASASKKYVSVKVKINAVTGADRYEVYRVVGSKASLVGTTKSGQTSLKDTKVTKRTVSYYAVAVSADGKVKSDKGASYKVTLAKAPKIKKVSSAGNGIKIEWKKNNSAKKYVVYRSTKKNSGYARVATVKKNRTYYVDKKAKKGKKYYYKVAVVTKKQASLMSKASKQMKR